MGKLLLICRRVPENRRREERAGSGKRSLMAAILTQPGRRACRWWLLNLATSSSERAVAASANVAAFGGLVRGWRDTAKASAQGIHFPQRRDMRCDQRFKQPSMVWHFQMQKLVNDDEVLKSLAFIRAVRDRIGDCLAELKRAPT
jgi:hypothetical protein